MTNNKFNLYNEEVKVAFINTLESDSTKIFARSTFNVLKEAEETLGKDLYDMEHNEIKNAMQVYVGRSERTKVMKLSILERYIDWSIEQGLRDSNFNSIYSIDNKKEWVARFV